MAVESHCPAECDLMYKQQAESNQPTILAQFEIKTVNKGTEMRKHEDLGLLASTVSQSVVRELKSIIVGANMTDC